MNLSAASLCGCAIIILWCSLCFFSAIATQSGNTVVITHILSKGNQCCMINCCRKILRSTVSCERCNCTCVPDADFLIKFDPPKMKELRLCYNRISLIANDSFTKFPELVNLFITNNCINIVEPNAFLGLNQLKILNLSSNPISRLPDNVFAPLKQLTVLRLDNTSTECNNFNSRSLGMENFTVKTFSLENNLQFVFPVFPKKVSGQFSMISSIENFNMGHNYLRELRAEYLAGFENLKSCI